MNKEIRALYKRGDCNHMSKARKTTYEERIDIVRQCLNNKKDYSRTARENGCSYQQVRNWVIRYERNGPAGLEDRRGRRSGSLPGRSMEEKLQYKVALLEKKNAQLQMEIDLLKKIDELESRNRTL